VALAPLRHDAEGREVDMAVRALDQAERFALDARGRRQRGPQGPGTAALRPGAPLTRATVQRLQAHGGNGALAALLEQERSDPPTGSAIRAPRAETAAAKAKPKSPGQEDKITDEKEKGKATQVQRSLGGALNQVGAAIERAFTGSAKVTPNFILSKPAAKRSNTDSSTTSGKDPTHTGSVVEQTKGAWNYRLDSVDAKGTIQIVYYDKSRYPAPFADWAPLSNVHENNWEEIRDDLRANRTGIADHWCAYDAEDTHEDYHWEQEWQPLVRRHTTAAEGRMNALTTPKAGTSQSDAEKILEPQAKTIFTQEMSAARRAWNAMGDAPGDPPYVAQAPSIDKLLARVEAKAKSQKWT
jgi:hypothetical protein